jgi:hypothetical protein
MAYTRTCKASSAKQEYKQIRNKNVSVCCLRSDLILAGLLAGTIHDNIVKRNRYGVSGHPSTSYFNYSKI